jgi:hypothetical protein
MKDLKVLEEILIKYDVDELWINFKDPFGEDHDKYYEEFYIVKLNAHILNNADFMHADYDITCFFAPKFASDEDEEMQSVEIASNYVAGKEPDHLEGFEKEKVDKKLTLLYRKGEGFLTA